jgi:hypothetical protein
MENNINQPSVPQELAPQPAPQSLPSPAKSYPYFTVAILVLVITGFLLLWYVWNVNFAMPTSVLEQPVNSSARQQAELNAEIDRVSIPDLNSSFEDIDRDLNQL